MLGSGAAAATASTGGLGARRVRRDAGFEDFGSLEEPSLNKLAALGRAAPPHSYSKPSVRTVATAHSASVADKLKVCDADSAARRRHSAAHCNENVKCILNVDFGKINLVFLFYL